jgi:hypothetical protein
MFAHQLAGLPFPGEVRALCQQKPPDGAACGEFLAFLCVSAGSFPDVF